MGLLETGKSLEGLFGPMIQIAMDFNRVPEAREVIEEKALIYERNIDTRCQ